MSLLRNTHQTLFPSILVLLLVGSIPVPQGIGQTPDRSIDAESPTEVTFHLAYDYGDSAPMKVTHVLVGGKEVQLGIPASVSGMWLRGVEIVIQNTSPKPIVAASIMLLYPETGNGSTEQPTHISGLRLGRLPAHSFLNKDDSMRPLGAEAQVPEISVPPGGFMTFAFGGENHSGADSDQIRGVEKAGKLTMIEIQLSKAYFKDGSLWNQGYFLLPVPAPEIWKKITRAEFLGTEPTQK